MDSQKVLKRHRRHAGLDTASLYFQSLLDSDLGWNDGNLSFCNPVNYDYAELVSIFNISLDFAFQRNRPLLNVSKSQKRGSESCRDLIRHSVSSDILGFRLPVFTGACPAGMMGIGLLRICL